jgi:hypothetical protein
MIPGTQVPILAAVDCGQTGCIVINGPDGSTRALKTPRSEDGSLDLEGYREALQGAEMVFIEKLSSGGFQGHTRISDNSAFAQYKELTGFFVGARIPFYAIRPQAWMKLLNFPSSKTVGKEQWKDFLHSQAIQRFPRMKVAKYQADAFLLYKVGTMLYPTQRSQWP